MDATVHSGCPVDSVELGRNTWSFLHTMAAYYPDRPSEKQKSEMTQFINIFAKFYPCEICAEDLREKCVTNVFFYVLPFFEITKFCFCLA